MSVPQVLFGEIRKKFFVYEINDTYRITLVRDPQICTKYEQNSQILPNLPSPISFMDLGYHSSTGSGISNRM